MSTEEKLCEHCNEKPIDPHTFADLCTDCYDELWSAQFYIDEDGRVHSYEY